MKLMEFEKLALKVLKTLFSVTTPPKFMTWGNAVFCHVLSIFSKASSTINLEILHGIIDTIS